MTSLLAFDYLHKLMAQPIPFDFVLDQLYEKNPRTRPMFGCTSVYIGEKIVLILRKKDDHVSDNGVWVCTSFEHHPGLKAQFPCLRSLALFDSGETSWQNIPEESPDFEATVLEICELIRKGDPRIGRIPKKKKPKSQSPIRRRTSSQKPKVQRKKKKS